MQAGPAIMQDNTLEIAAEDGVLIRAQVYGSSTATRLVISHGNGLAAEGYESFWRQLLPDYQVVLLDVRGHGKSDRGPSEHHAWPRFEQDFDMAMREIREALGERKTFGVFHSLSAIVSLQHARRFGPVCDGLILFDPPIIPPDGHPLHQQHVDEMLGLAQRVAKRRTHFDACEDLAAQFRRNAMYSRCLPQACDEMARALLRPVSDDDRGAWTLACDPEREARIFASNYDTTLWGWLEHVDFPLKLVCADPAVPGVQPSAAIGRELAETFGLDYAFVPDTTHFLQLERPDSCAALVREFCR